MGLRARRPYVETVLTDRHRQLRLQWARRHLWYTGADWARVLFTDESKFNLRRSDGRARVYRRRGERFSDNCVRERGQFGDGSGVEFPSLLNLKLCMSLATWTPSAIKILYCDQLPYLTSDETGAWSSCRIMPLVTQLVPLHKCFSKTIYALWICRHVAQISIQ